MRRASGSDCHSQTKPDDNAFGNLFFARKHLAFPFAVRRSQFVPRSPFPRSQFAVRGSPCHLSKFLPPLPFVLRLVKILFSCDLSFFETPASEFVRNSDVSRALTFLG